MIRRQKAVARIADVQTRRSSSDWAACAMVQMAASNPHPLALKLLQQPLARRALQTALGTKALAIPISSFGRQRWPAACPTRTAGS